ncbi:hypothetical protein [Glaciihabitans sp. dw_435]|uniref:hypothetical protein n=1 Tax=Glaciihabitans sp. dw_435 TaxID=2720081 RepID=UPI001BD3A196|nr:hypothetical protein [Glaciihabitans sp. dw_435]
MNELPRPDELAPLLTDADVETRVSTLIGRATVRQLWLLFLDDDGVQLPLLLPIEGLPPSPRHTDLESMMTSISHLMSSIGADSAVLVWERYGAATLTANDVSWLQALVGACAVENLAIRAVLLSYRNGVRWVAPDDYI